MKRNLTILTQRTLIVLSAVVVLAAAAAFLTTRPSSTPSTSHVNAARIVTAARAYERDLKARGAVLPSSVSLRELVRRGLLSPTDVSGFEGMDVTVSLGVRETQPQEVLMRARLPDGHQMVLLADGSVQQTHR